MLYEGRIALSIGYNDFFNRCKNVWKMIKLRIWIPQLIKGNFIFYILKLNLGYTCQRTIQESLKNHYPAFVQPAPGILLFRVWRATVPLYVSDSKANVSDCKHSKPFCCYQASISTPRLHQMHCSVRHYCTITLTVKSRNDAAQSVMQQI